MHCNHDKAQIPLLSGTLGNSLFCCYCRLSHSSATQDHYAATAWLTDNSRGASPREGIPVGLVLPEQCLQWVAETSLRISFTLSWMNSFHSLLIPYRVTWESVKHLGDASGRAGFRLSVTEVRGLDSSSAVPILGLSDVVLEQLRFGPVSKLTLCSPMVSTTSCVDASQNPHKYHDLMSWRFPAK